MCDRPDYVSSHVRYDRFDTSAYWVIWAYAANYYINIFLKSQELLKLNLFGCIINLDNYACGDCSCLYVLSEIKNPHNHTYKIFRVGGGADREIIIK